MKIMFAGDTVPTACNAELFAAGEARAIFGDALSLFEGNDFNCVNLECALTESDAPIRKIGPALKAPLGTAATLAAIGVTHCALSNNHIFDYGKRGARDTLAALAAAGIATTGFGDDEADAEKNLVIEKDGERLCVIAVCEHEYSFALPDRMGARPFDPFRTPLAVRAAKKDCDRVVVLYHGGKEQCRYPSPRLREACRAMAESGADLILCQHSHCVGCYEQVADCHILYGQGNFCFVTDDDLEGWNDGFAVRYDTATHEIGFIPVVSDRKHGIRQANGAEKEAIFAAFDARCRALESDGWREGWHAFCESMRAQYTRAAARACVEEYGEKAVEKFAHYLYCEAHTDVWKELFPIYNFTNEK